MAPTAKEADLLDRVRAVALADDDELRRLVELSCDLVAAKAPRAPLLAAGRRRSSARRATRRPPGRRKR